MNLRFVKTLLALACLFALPLAVRTYPIIPRLLVIAIISAMGFGLLIRVRKLAVTHRNTVLKNVKYLLYRRSNMH